MGKHTSHNAIAMNVIAAAIIATSVTVATGVDVAAQGVRGFGVIPGKLPLRGFGNPHGEEALRMQFPEAAAAIVGDDRSLARHQINVTDANADGMVTQQEWTESGFQSPERFPHYDLNGDGILTFYEHCIGIAAWRRRTERRSDASLAAQNALAREREKEAIDSNAILEEAPPVDLQIVARGEQVQQLADHLLAQYDVNENGVVERVEYRSQSSGFGNVSGADRNQDGEITLVEIAKWIEGRLPPLSRLPLDLQARDLNHDDQLTFREYVTVTDQSTIDEFARLDRNDDGVITPKESLVSQDASSKYENSRALIIKPNGSVVSSIWIEDDTLIGQVQVNVNIMKENDSYTALFLLSPGGQRVPLFAGNGWQPWRGALILKDVTFHDAAPVIKRTLDRPPFRRQLHPSNSEDVSGLGSLEGTSARGMWRLIVRNQDDLTGLLVHWSLVVTPEANSG